MLDEEKRLPVLVETLEQFLSVGIYSHFWAVSDDQEDEVESCLAVAAGAVVHAIDDLFFEDRQERVAGVATIGKFEAF